MKGATARTGKVLATTGPVHSSDVRLRRAQALAHESGAALRIARELISRKLAGQETVARDKLGNSAVAQMIHEFRAELETAETVSAVRQLEAQAGYAYWSAWRELPITFPKNDLRRIPDHWLTFGTRQSPLTGSPRRAANPANAILNYLYALLESEARLAAAALGLDPGLGFLHVDTPARDSLACDLMEPVRPQIDCYLLDWITRQPLKREWFFEQRDGTCRLMGPFAIRLTESMPTWGRAVAPFAEWVARTLWETNPKARPRLDPPTRLTQSHKREVKGSTFILTNRLPTLREKICRTCGTTITYGQTHCRKCSVGISRERLIEVAKAGRIAGQSAEAQARRSDTQRRHEAAKHAWSQSNQPVWLTEEAYAERILPQLTGVTNSGIASALGVSLYYAAAIRRGKRRPHPRHWLVLAALAGI